MNKQTVVFDFDGVIHSYISGWKGIDNIPDPPVSGAADGISAIRNAGYEVAVVSTRCAEQLGIDAVKSWLDKYGIVVDRICKEKPPAVVYVDDRAICFDGEFSSLLEKVATFTPWYRKGKAHE